MRPGKISKLILFVLMGLAIGVTALFYFYPRYLRNILVPEIEQIKKIRVSLEGDTAFADFRLNLKNKGIFKINIDSLFYEVQFDTLRVLSGSEAPEIVLKPGEAGRIHFPVALPYKRIMKRIRQLKQMDSIDITTEVRIVYNTIFGRMAVPHKMIHRIATPVPPEFELEKVRFVKFSGNELYFDLYLKMTNGGKLELDVSDIKYTVNLKELWMAEGIIYKTIKVTPGSSHTEVLRVRVRPVSFFKALRLIITNKDQVPYHIKVSAAVNAGETSESTLIVIEKSGIVELRN